MFISLFCDTCNNVAMVLCISILFAWIVLLYCDLGILVVCNLVGCV